MSSSLGSSSTTTARFSISEARSSGIPASASSTTRSKSSRAMRSTALLPLLPAASDGGVEAPPAGTEENDRGEGEEVDQGQLGIAPLLEAVGRHVAPAQPGQELIVGMVAEERRHARGEGGERGADPGEQPDHDQDPRDLGDRRRPGEKLGGRESQPAHAVDEAPFAAGQPHQLAPAVLEGQQPAGKAEDQKAQVRSFFVHRFSYSRPPARKCETATGSGPMWKARASASTARSLAATRW